MLKLMLATWAGVFMGFGMAALCQAGKNSDAELEEMTDLYKRKRSELLTTDEEILHVPDGVGFVGLTENPFRHGCCDCGLWHTVGWTLCDYKGDAMPVPDGAILALKFTRDEVKTRQFRENNNIGNVTETNFGDIL